MSLLLGVLLGEDATRYVRVAGKKWRVVTVGKFYECPVCFCLIEGKPARMKHIERCQQVTELLEKYEATGGLNGSENHRAARS